VKALVTGGAGFIGSALVERLLAEDHAVDVVDDLSTGSLANLADARAEKGKTLRIHQADISTPEIVALIERRAPDVVFHLACRPLAGLAEDAAINLVGGLRVIEGALAAGTRKVVLASDAQAVYGEVDAAKLPVRESQPPAPSGPAGVSKRAIVDHLRLLREADNLDFTALALSTVYGPRDIVGPVAARADGAAVEGGTLDLVYVDDAVDAFVRAATRAGGLVCNIGTGVEVAGSEVARLLAEQTGQPPRDLQAIPGRRFAVDAGRAKIHLGWSPWTSLPDGLSHFLRWRATSRA
jgi:UDP-glucose 4-epimerase